MTSLFLATLISSPRQRQESDRRLTTASLLETSLAEPASLVLTFRSHGSHAPQGLTKAYVFQFRCWFDRLFSGCVTLSVIVIDPSYPVMAPLLPFETIRKGLAKPYLHAMSSECVTC